MPDEAFNWMSRIKAVEREYGAIRFATDHILAAAHKNPAVLGDEVKRPDVGAASARLEGTYLIRVFAEFETALVHFIRAFHIQKPRTTRTLIDRVRDRGRIPQADADAVHKVRDYRNQLVHDRTTPAPQVTIRDATRFLCIYLSRVQRIW